MAPVKITIDNICAFNTGHQSKIKPCGHVIFLSYSLSQLPLSEDKIVTLLFSCRAPETSIGKVASLDTASHVFNVKTLSFLKEGEEEGAKKKKKVNQVSVSFYASIRAR